jgi:riboflavin synthase
MFTGIVTAVGGVDRLDVLDGAARLTVTAPGFAEALELGESVAVDGVCLTVSAVAGDRFTADLMPETLARSTLGAAVPGRPVNLERALAVGDRLGGHLVQGHVDGTGLVTAREPAARWTVLRIRVAAELARYLAEKGSVAVDGVSLTVTTVDDDGFAVSLIPTTLAETTLGQRAPGDRVNVEVDVLAKYVERLAIR